MEFKDLTEEQKAKVQNAKTKEELMAIAEEEGFELTGEELEGIDGGMPCFGYNGCEAVLNSDWND